MQDKVYIGFENWEDVEREFKASLGPEPDVIYAQYDQGDYEGDANIVFKRGDVWRYVTGSHCSCYGLGGQWSEEDFDPRLHVEQARAGRRSISMYLANDDQRLQFDRWIDRQSGVLVETENEPETIGNPYSA